MNTQESNKLIAEFMGWKYAGTERRGIWPWCKKEPFYSHPAYSFKVWGNFFEYDHNWNYLMAVVNRIGILRVKSSASYNPDLMFRIAIVNGHTEIVGATEMIFFNSSIEGSMLNATYKAVVKFIQWYNNYNSQPSNTTP